MTILHSVLVILLLVIWLCISLSILISTVLGIKNELRREKRDAEYHKKRMKEHRY